MEGVRVRPWQEDDGSQLRGLASGFSTDVVYRVADEGTCFCLRETQLDAPLVKAYPIPPVPDDPRSTFVAEIGGRVIGYAELGIELWNRRGIVRHLRVADGHRRIGRLT